MQPETWPSLSVAPGTQVSKSVWQSKPQAVLAAPKKAAPPPPPPGPSPTEYVGKTVTIMLHKPNASSKVGMVLTGKKLEPPEIQELKAGGCAEAAAKLFPVGGSPLLHVGQTLVAVNGKKVYGHVEATNVLRAALGDVVLTLSAPKASGIAADATGPTDAPLPAASLPANAGESPAAASPTNASPAAPVAAVLGAAMPVAAVPVAESPVAAAVSGTAVPVGAVPIAEEQAVSQAPAPASAAPSKRNRRGSGRLTQGEREANAASGGAELKAAAKGGPTPPPEEPKAAKEEPKARAPKAEAPLCAAEAPPATTPAAPLASTPAATTPPASTVSGTPLPAKATMTVMLHKRDVSSRLGVVLTGLPNEPPTIKELKAGSIAADAGLLQCGMLLLSVNDEQCFSHVVATDLLKAASGDVVLRLALPSAAAPSSSAVARVPWGDRQEQPLPAHVPPPPLVEAEQPPPAKQQSAKQQQPVAQQPVATATPSAPPPSQLVAHSLPPMSMPQPPPAAPMPSLPPAQPATHMAAPVSTPVSSTPLAASPPLAAAPMPPPPTPNHSLATAPPAARVVAPPAVEETSRSSNCVFMYAADEVTSLHARGPMPPFSVYEMADGLELILSTFNLTVTVDELAHRADAFGLSLSTDTEQNALVSYSALTPSAVMVGGGDDQPADCRLEMCLGPSFDLQQVEFIESSQRLRIKLPKKTGKMRPLRLQVQKIRGD